METTPWPRTAEPHVILLSRLDNSRVLVNFETVKYVDAIPDTVVQFLNGDSLIVREPLEEVERRVVEYKVKILQQSDAPKS